MWFALFLLMVLSGVVSAGAQHFRLQTVHDSLSLLTLTTAGEIDTLPLPYPVYRFATGDLTGDGKEEAVVGVVKSTRFFADSAPRLFILKNYEGHIRTLWRGSRIGGRLIDFRIVGSRIRCLMQMGENQYSVGDFHVGRFGLRFDKFVIEGVSKENALPAFYQQDRELAVAFTGDILLDRGVRRQIDSLGVESLFTPSMDSLLRTADCVVGNLECPVTEIRSPLFKRFVFRGEPEWLEPLRLHGVTHLNLANNHSIDQGRRGLMSTIAHVKENGMTPFGADSTLSAAVRPVLLTCSPREVYVLPSVQMPLEQFPLLPGKPMPAAQSVDSLCAGIQRLKAAHPGCCVIICLHWGKEHTLEPTPTQRHQAHQLVDAGADALVCHHTHTLQSVEHYHGAPIFYSLGNYIFDLPADINRRGAVVIMHITADSLRAEQHPFTIVGCTPCLH